MYFESLCTYIDVVYNKEILGLVKVFIHYLYSVYCIFKPVKLLIKH